MDTTDRWSEGATDYVELRFGPRWTYISCVRKFVAGFFLIGLSDKERAEQISLAASELLENAVKYSSDEEAGLYVRVARRGDEVDVSVRNPATAEQMAVLRREFALINSGNPEEVYLRRMEEAAQTQSQSRLGLIRIRYEGQAVLRLELLEREVCIHAVFQLVEA